MSNHLFTSDLDGVTRGHLQLRRARAPESPLLRQAAARYPRDVQRLLIAAGLAIAVLGLLWPWLSKLPLGRLPGDLLIERPGFRFYAPFTTMILVSLVLSLLIWLWRH
jgi:hypothetical protein